MELGNSIAGVVSRNVKAARISAGLSQKELARRSGLSIRYISRLETKPQNIRIDNVALLASHLGIEPAAFLVEGLGKLPDESQAVLSDAIRLLETLREPQ
jgi:transcriptional regulator with XRE-family HTH domain